MKNHSHYLGKEKGGHILFPYEKKIKDKIIPKAPHFIETYHLTYTTLIWSVLVILSSYWSRNNVNYLIVVNIAIFMQYFTDVLDGSLGRYRKTGLIKWGFFMDHFMDYVFGISIIIGYLLMLPDLHVIYILLILISVAGVMIATYLYTSASKSFSISVAQIGPSEVRIIIILLNTISIFFGLELLKFLLKVFSILSVVTLITVVYIIQKRLWRLDMENKLKK